MEKGFRKTAIGVMSGTSLDGLDICYSEFRFDDVWSFEIIETECISYSSIWESKLSTAHQLSQEVLYELHLEYGTYIGTQVVSFLQSKSLTTPDLVCSHGHTVRHEPDKGITLQIGDGQEIANHTGSTTISDFRSLDVSLGGQGAPLVPIGDKLLFSEYDACLNLGGFSNISFEESGERQAFDICPVNIVLNALSCRLGKPFDENGMLARSGKVDELLLHQLNSLEPYAAAKRPSLAREWVESTINPLLDESAISETDLLRTFVEHAAIQMARVTESHVAGGRVLVTGGGVYNSLLLERTRAFSLADLFIPDKQTIEFKEALIFAFLGVLKSDNQINVLRSVTGAQRDSSSGMTHYPYL